MGLQRICRRVSQKYGIKANSKEGDKMIKLEKTDVYGWKAAIRGMRNPMNSWDKSDSTLLPVYASPANYVPEIGTNDRDLMLRLAAGGSVHAKYRRMITVTADITAPLYWWKEFDTYKVGTVANSCSTMHKIHAKEFTLDDFSCEYLVSGNLKLLEQVVENLNVARNEFINYDGSQFRIENDSQIVDKKVIWHQMIQLLPSSYNQKRTVLLNYEVLVGMYRDRKNHKLDEWHTLCDWIRSLPYSEIITGEVS
jgi:hypothetical protein